MTTIGSMLRDRLVAAFSASTVAEAAGLSYSVWNDTAAPHVFVGLGGFLGGRNRGRLPFVEIDVQGRPYQQTSAEGGVIVSTLVARVYVGGRDLGVAGDLTEAILLAGATAFRDTSLDNYTAVGNEELGELTPSAWGLHRDMRFQVENVYERSNYGVQ